MKYQAILSNQKGETIKSPLYIDLQELINYIEKTDLNFIDIKEVTEWIWQL